MELGLTFWLAFAVTLGVMVVLGLLTERIVLRPLVNQPQITLFMATIGLTFFIEGLAQLIWGAQRPRRSTSASQDEPIAWIAERDRHEHLASSTSSPRASPRVLVTSLALFFSRTRIGRALRAVADDHQAALAVGIPLQQIWAHRLGASPASSRWSRACCGARATACSSR